KKMLDEAKGAKDSGPLAELASRYGRTKAGMEAIRRLADYHFGERRFSLACVCYERLFERQDMGKAEPETVYRAAFAYRKVGDKTAADQVWKELKPRIAKDGLRVGDRTLTADDVQKELENTRPDKPANLDDWLVHGGDASRSAQGAGGAPLLE